MYAAQCELIKYEDDPQELGKLLGDIGIAPNKWILFIYNDSDRPNEVIFIKNWTRGRLKLTIN